MPKVPLSQSNPFLRDPKKFREGLIESVASSTAIETGQKTDSVAKAMRERAEHRDAISKRAR